MNAAIAPRSWSLITVTYNSASKLARYWADVSLPETCEWVVVDNASTDDSARVAASLGARVIQLSANLGFGAANNVGFRQSNSEYVAFVNPDVTPRLTDLDTLALHLRDEPDALVAPQLVYPDMTEQPNGRGAPYLLHKVLNRLYPSAVEGAYLRLSHGRTPVDVTWLTGAVVAGTRAHLGILGPWDEHFFVYYEDTDLGLRNTLHGGRSVVLGDITWIHGWAREAKGLNLAAWRLELGSAIRFFRRYPRFVFGGFGSLGRRSR